MEAQQRSTRAPGRDPRSQSQSNLSDERKEVELDYNPRYRVNTVSPHCYKEWGDKFKTGEKR